MTQSQFAKRYGQRLREARERLKRGGADISQPSIAEFVGVSHSSVRRWERGERLPTVWEHSRLIDMLGAAFEVERA